MLNVKKSEVSVAQMPPPVLESQTQGVVEVEHVSLSYGKTKALDDVSFSVGKGEVVGILGPNGAGKTTMLEILEGLKKADQGSISIFGVNPAKSSNKIRDKVGVVMQHTALPPALKVVELVDLYRTIYKADINMKAFLEDTGLIEKFNSQVKELSGGQKQRLAIALAILGHSELLFLDEPTSELDPQARRMVWKLLKERCETQQTSMVLTTHQMEEAAVLCDRIIILDHGEILDEGSPQELIHKHCPGQRISFSCQNNANLDGFEALPYEISTKQRSNLIEVTIKCDDLQQTLAELLNLCQKSNLLIPDLRVVSNTLEDVFLHLTGRTLRD